MAGPAGGVKAAVGAGRSVPVPFAVLHESTGGAGRSSEGSTPW